MQGLLGALLQPLLEALFAAFGRALADLFATWRLEQNARAAGAADHAAQVNKESADAERRASEAAKNAARGADLDRDLIDGRVRY